VDREGGSFYQEWSALFVMEGSQGERIFFHYPRLQTVASAQEAALPLDSKTEGRAGAGVAQRPVSGAAGDRSSGWGTGGLLPEFLASGQCAGLAIS
jgi:hypothetical protein